MYNRIILIGNLTKDPELRYTPTGTAVASFRIAVNTRYKQSDQQREDTLFIGVVTFGKQAETCNQYLTKGKSVLVEGRLQERRWASEGKQHSKFEVISQNVRFLSGRDGSPAEPQGAGDDVPPYGTTDSEPF